MDICYIYCTPIPESKGEFYALPTLRIAKMFDGTPHTVHVLGIGDLDTSGLEAHGATCHVYNRRFASLGLVGLYIQLFAIALYHSWRVEFDVFSNVWAHYNLAPVLLAAKLTGGRVFARVFGQGNPWTRERAEKSIRNSQPIEAGRILTAKLLNTIEQLLLRSVTHVYSNAECVRDILIGQGVPETAITVLSQGVDTEFFTPSADSPSEPTVLFVGRIKSPEKRFRDALTAFESIEERVPSVTLAVAGSKELPEDLLNRVEGDDSIQLLGYLNRTELREAYQTASVLLLTSSKEGVPNVILEAHACGLPVVATDAGDVGRVISEAGGGEVVPIGDTAGISQNLHRLLDNDDIRHRLGMRGRRYVEHEHSLAVIADEYIHLFQEQECLANATA